MKGKIFVRAIIIVIAIITGIVFFIYITGCSKAEKKDAERYIEAVREFADNVLSLGKDTYGEKSTPLFVDGLNIYNHEPGKWKRDGEEWILSNQASQQNLFRTFVGLTNLTNDYKYRDAAVGAIKYAFENIRGPNGLLYWGGHMAYDAQSEKLVMEQKVHEFKSHYPYYELMWEVNPEITKQFIDALWGAHILNWSNLEFNRHAKYDTIIENPWDNEYEGGEVFFWGTGLTFLNAGSDLYYAAAVLSKLSGEKKPLVWAKRLAYRYVETRNPKTGIGGFQFSQSRTAGFDSSDIRGDRAQIQYGEYFPGHFVVEGTLFPCYGSTPFVQPQITQMLLGEMLGKDGKEFTQWAVEELTAWGRSAYRAEDNSFIPMLTDGTSMEGFVCQKDGYFGPKGRVLRAGKGGPSDFWTYVMGFRVSGDEFLWGMARNIAMDNDFGDIGKTANDKPQLNLQTTSSEDRALWGFLELYRKLNEPAYLEMAKHIGDNILKDRFFKGFFVQSKDHLYAKFERMEPLALLHLAATILDKQELVPVALPGSGFFHCPYDGVGRTYDNSVIYGRRVSQNR